MSVSFGTLGYVDRLQPPPPAPPTPPVPSSAVNLFQKAELWVNRERTKFAVVPVTLSRGVDTFITVATPGKTPFTFLDRHMITHRIESRDYIINVADYQFNLALQRPEKGDKIIEVQGALKFTYEVLPFNDEPVYRFSGTYRTSYRVHTKLIKEEDV